MSLGFVIDHSERTLVVLASASDDIWLNQADDQMTRRNPSRKKKVTSTERFRDAEIYMPQTSRLECRFHILDYIWRSVKAGFERTNPWSAGK